jgi:protein-L-isoaspartate(D-aspartate) O-methyltransferase
MTRAHRQQLVRRMEAESAIRSAPVRNAFLDIPREIFIPDVAQRLGIGAVYRDEAYPIKTDDRGEAISSSSQPQIMALMLEELRISPGHRVWEIGTGTGWNAALLSALTGAKGRVTSIELDPELATQARRSIRAAGQRATVVVGDGQRGWWTNAPYDRIIATASSLDVPRSFLQQLKQGGLLVLPLRLSDGVPFRQIVVTFVRVGDRLRSASVIRGGFMRLRDRPEDPSLPWPVSKAIETRDGTERTLASLSGSTLNRLHDRERRDLLALLLSHPRSRTIRMRLSTWGLWELESFILLAAPEEVVVGCTREDLGHLLFYSTAFPAIIDKDSRSLAHLAGSRSASRIDAYGEASAERMLIDLVDEWRRRGRPGISRLSVEVSYGRASPKGVWRSRRRGSSAIAFDYR